MDDVQSVLRQILQDGYLMSLATTDKGVVWIADVNFILQLPALIP